MRKIYTFAIIVLAVFLWSATIGSVRSQNNRKLQPSTVSEGTYEKVLDILFPRDVLKDPTLRFAFVLQYKPTFKPESQIVIVARQSGLEVITYRSDGNIETRLDDLVRSGQKEIPEWMAKQIKVQKQTVTLSKQSIDQFHTGFFEALALSERPRLQSAANTVNVTFDGTEYRLWYVGRSQIQCEFQGSGITNATRPEESAVMDWMKKVNQTVLHREGQ